MTCPDHPRVQAYAFTRRAVHRVVRALNHNPAIARTCRFSRLERAPLTSVSDLGHRHNLSTKCKSLVRYPRRSRLCARCRHLRELDTRLDAACGKTAQSQLKRLRLRPLPEFWLVFHQGRRPLVQILPPSEFRFGRNQNQANRFRASNTAQMCNRFRWPQ